jgi:hypothetical protein
VTGENALSVTTGCTKIAHFLKIGVDCGLNRFKNLGKKGNKSTKSKMESQCDTEYNYVI